VNLGWEDDYEGEKEREGEGLEWESE